MRNDLIPIFEAAAEIDRATSVAEVISRLRANIERFGLAACLITNLPHQRAGGWQEHILINEWPRGWYERYLRAGHYRHDPCVSLSRTATAPFLWSIVTQPGMQSQSRVVMDEAREFGLREGICIPIEDANLGPAVVTLAGEEIDLAPVARCTVHVLARHAYRAAARLVLRSPGQMAHALSRREREILQWFAEGKTAWAISRILNISENTVNTHMRNMRQKLNTSNAVHTVTEALRRREIEL
jgi:LuxR family quorum sensing-dependent transcriptional regulator